MAEMQKIYVRDLGDGRVAIRKEGRLPGKPNSPILSVIGEDDVFELQGVELVIGPDGLVMSPAEAVVAAENFG